MQIYNVRTGGRNSVTLGLKKVNSFNVAPVTVVATPTGYLMTANDVDQYDMFTVAQTGAATDLVILPNAVDAPIGTVVYFLASSIARIKAGATGSGLTINGASDALSVPLVVGGQAEFTKLTATNWICLQTSSAGVTSTPTPS